MLQSFNQSIEKVERLILIEKENSFYSFLVDFTPVIAGFVFIVFALVELVALLETYHRYESYIAKKELEIYEELTRNVEQFLHHHSNTNANNRLSNI